MPLGCPPRRPRRRRYGRPAIGLREQTIDERNGEKLIPAKGEAVLVTTVHPGIFFGYLKARTIRGDRVILLRMRKCIYQSRATKSYLGLATMGPDKYCLVTPAAEQCELRDVTSIIQCTKEACANWEKAPWREML